MPMGRIHVLAAECQGLRAQQLPQPSSQRVPTNRRILRLGYRPGRMHCPQAARCSARMRSTSALPPIGPPKWGPAATCSIRESSSKTRISRPTARSPNPTYPSEPLGGNSTPFRLEHSTHSADISNCLSCAASAQGITTSAKPPISQVERYHRRPQRVHETCRRPTIYSESAHGFRLDTTSS